MELVNNSYINIDGSDCFTGMTVKAGLDAGIPAVRSLLDASAESDVVEEVDKTVHHLIVSFVPRFCKKMDFYSDSCIIRKWTRTYKASTRFASGRWDPFYLSICR